MIDPVSSLVEAITRFSISAATLLKSKDADNFRNDLSELQQVIIESHSRVYSLIVQISSLQSEISELQAKILKSDQFESEKQRYTLYAPWQGTMVYALKESMSNGDPPHYLCTNCYAENKKSILNQIQGKDRWFMLCCPACKAQIQSPYAGPCELKFA